MADLDAWWTANFHKYSIRDLQKLPIFHQFLQLHYPYERMMDTSKESFKTDELADTFERSSDDQQESFTHNKKERRYTYVRKYHEKDCSVTLTSHTEGEIDWGSLVKIFDGWEHHETWRLEPPDREYQKFTIEKGVKKGFRCGIKPRDDNTERWVEEFWSSEDEDVYKKTWEKEGESGGETKTRKKAYTWGEEWYSNGTTSHKKVWHEEGERKWGQESGAADSAKWEHKWDFNIAEKLDEKVTVRNGKTVGYRYTAKGEDWYKQEWEGEKSIPSDQDHKALGARFLIKLQELYQRTEAAANYSDQTLRNMAQSVPAMKAKVEAMSARLTSLKAVDKTSPEELFTHINALRDLENEQETLKKSVWEAGTVEWKLLSHYITQLHDVATDSLESLAALAKVVLIDEFDAKIVKARKDVNDMVVQPGVSYGTHMERWRQQLAALESLKREYLRHTCQLVPTRAVSEVMERAMKRQDLEDAVKHAYVLLLRTHDFVRDLSAVVGDDKALDSTMALKKKFEATYNLFMREHEVEQFLDLMENLKSHNSLQVSLLARIRGSEDISSAPVASIKETVEAVAALVAQCRDMTRSVKPLKALAKDQEEIESVLGGLSSGLEAADPEGTIESLPVLVQPLKAWGTLFPRLLAKLSDEGGYEAVKMLEPIVGDLHQLAKESASGDQDIVARLASLQREAKSTFADLSQSPSDGDSKKAVRLVRSYCLLLRSVGVKADTSSPFSVLESFLSDVYSSAMDEVKGDTDAESSIHELKTLLESAFSELLALPSRANFSRMLTALGQYAPISRSYILRSLEGLFSEVDRVCVALSPEVESQLLPLRQRLADPMRDAKTKAKGEHVSAVLAVVGEYRKVLATLPRPLKSPGILKEEGRGTRLAIPREDSKLSLDLDQPSPKMAKAVSRALSGMKTPGRKPGKK